MSNRPTPVFATQVECGRGAGLAVCHLLRLVVTSDSHANTLTVFRLPVTVDPEVMEGMELARVCTLGDASCPPRMRFKFTEETESLAFTGPATARLLLVTDAGNNAVHVVRVGSRSHVGYVAPPGLLRRPRCVASSLSGSRQVVAVSAWRTRGAGDHQVHLFEGSGPLWTRLRVLGRGCGPALGRLHAPTGVRFTPDGSGLVVVDSYNLRVSLFRLPDMAFVQHLCTAPRTDQLIDVQAWVEGSELCPSDPFDVKKVTADCWPETLRSGSGMHDIAVANAWVPGLGVVARRLRCDWRGRESTALHFFASEDALAMAHMTPIRVAWMVGVVRGILVRRRFGGSVVVGQWLGTLSGTQDVCREVPVLLPTWATPLHPELQSASSSPAATPTSIDLSCKVIVDDSATPVLHHPGLLRSTACLAPTPRAVHSMAPGSTGLRGSSITPVSGQSLTLALPVSERAPFPMFRGEKPSGYHPAYTVAFATAVTLTFTAIVFKLGVMAMARS
jgi:hypothetical protein